MYALTKIKGVGRRYSNLVCKKADVDLNKRYASTSKPRLATRDPKDTTNSLPVLVSSPRKSLSVSSPSSRTPRSTRSPPGSSTDSATLSTARTRRSSPTVSTPSSVTILSASRRSAPTVVSVTTGASAFAASTPRPPAAAAEPSVSPRRRVVSGDAFAIETRKDFSLRCFGWDGRDGWFLLFETFPEGLCFSAYAAMGAATLDQSHEKIKEHQNSYHLQAM